MIDQDEPDHNEHVRDKLHSIAMSVSWSCVWLFFIMIAECTRK